MRLIRAAALFAVTALAVLLPSASANATAEQTNAGVLSAFRHVQSGLCLDGSVSQGLRLADCNGSSFQQWRYSSSAQIVHSQSGRCLDGSVSQGVSLATCNGGAYQEWGFSTRAQIVHLQSGRCLDGSVSSGVRLPTCNGGVYQQWLT